MDVVIITGSCGLVGSEAVNFFSKTSCLTPSSPYSYVASTVARDQLPQDYQTLVRHSTRSDRLRDFAPHLKPAWPRE